MITVKCMTTDIHGANMYFNSLTKSIKENDLNAFSYLVQYFYGVYPYNAMFCHSENKYKSRLVNMPIVDSVSWKDMHSYLLNVIEYCIEHENNQIPIFILELFPSELEEIEKQLGDEFFAKKYIKEVREKYSKLKMI